MTTHINVKRWSIAVFGKMRVLALLSCTLSSTLAGLPRATPLQSSVIKYAGTLPCADCAGIRTLLTLYSEPGPTRYVLAETYIGTKDGDRAFLNSGRWTILRGSAADADATVFQLDFDRPDRARNFLREGDYHLVQLDRNQAALPARNSHFLLRVPNEALNPIVITDTDAPGQVRASQGQWVILRLPSNPSTGFRWSLSRPASGLRQRGEPTYVRDTSPTGPGAGGSEIWSLSADRAGEYRLQFVYRRPWEPASPSQKEVTFVVQVRR